MYDSACNTETARSIRRLCAQDDAPQLFDTPSRCTYICARGNQPKQDRAAVGAGWLVEPGGGSHDVFTHPSPPGVIIVVPRHRELSPGVYRQIDKQAGWR